MGLLSNPKAREKIAILVARYSNKLCFLCYIVGFTWFLALAHNQLNAKTYFSENALLPGLVDSDFYNEFGTTENYNELKTLIKERNTDPDLRHKIPLDWLYRKFREASLDVYIQNYTFKYPFKIYKDQELSGQNVYAILRAPRASGTEALVLSAPFRPDLTSSEGTHAGIALMLGLAKAFRRHSYWAKDIIFLVTDNEDIGIQAWLSAYHQTPNQYIQPGQLPGRSGAIQAAINLELGSDLISRMNIRVEGLNGQLPNLDLFNTVARLCMREGISPAIQKRTNYWNYHSWDGYQYALKTMFMMMWNQAPGSPTGNHGFFHRYNIEAVTLHGVRMKNAKQYYAVPEMGRVVEGIFRSLNNLLERFHQSFFFYLLPSTDRYVSIGVYMPPFGILVLPIAIKAISLWLSAGAPKSNDDKSGSETGKSASEKKAKDASVDTDDEQEDGDSKNKASQTKEVDGREKDGSESNQIEDADSEASQSLGQLLCYIPHFLTAIFFGLGAFHGTNMFITTADGLKMPPEEGIAIGFLAVHFAVICFPFLFKWRLSKKQDNRIAEPDVRILKCVALLVLGIVFGATSVMNISLAFFIAVTWIPVVLIVRPTSSRIFLLLQILLLILISPLGLMFLAAIFHQLIIIQKSTVDGFAPILVDAWKNVQGGLLFSALQSHMFGSWTYGLVTLVILPNWILFWMIPFCKISQT